MVMLSSGFWATLSSLRRLSIVASFSIDSDGRVAKIIMSGKKYDYYNIANIARLLSELPDEDLKEVMFIIEYKRKRLEEKKK